MSFSRALCALSFLGVSYAQTITPVTGAGSTLAAPLYQSVATAYAQYSGGKAATVTFYGMGSGKGICRLENNCNATADPWMPKLIDFAGSDSVLADKDYQGSLSDMQMYPAVAAAVVPVYNVPGISNLVLNLDVLAKIYMGSITVWNDAQIKALNPSLNLPSNAIIEVARSDNSGTTEIFKKGLAKGNADFATVVGTASSFTWGTNTANVKGQKGNLGVISYVQATNYTLGYAALGEALDAFLAVASLKVSADQTVTASPTSIAAAVASLGASFGNNGDSASHLTADLEGVAPPAWPIVGYTYFVMRKSTLRTGATCDTVYQTINFLNFFYTNPAVPDIVKRLNFAPLSSSVMATVLGRLIADVKCNGNQVFVSLKVIGAGSTLAAPLYQDAAVTYEQYTSKADIAFYGMGSGKGVCRVRGNCPATDTTQPTSVNFAGSDSILAAGDYTSYSDIQMYPAVAAAVVPVYNLPGLDGLVLNMDVLARIFYGAIKKWNDPMIANLNTAKKALLPNAAIIVVVRSDSSGTTEIFKKALANASVTFKNVVGPSSNATWGNYTNSVTRMQGNLGVISYVGATVNTIGYAALGEAMDNFLQFASLLSGTTTVTASTTSIAAAVTALGGNWANNGDVPTGADKTVHLTADLVGAKAPAWPIVGYTYFVLRKSSGYAGTSCTVVNQTVAFLKFFYTNPVMAAVIQNRQFAPLSSAVLAKVVARLTADVTCNGKPAGMMQRVRRALQRVAAKLRLGL